MEEEKVEQEIVPEPQTPVEEVDYGKELKEAQEQKEAARIGYAARKAMEVVEAPEEQDNSDLIAEKVIQKVLPVLNNATQSNLIESKLDNLSGGNDALKRLIKFHMDNTINPNLDLNERAEAAYAIANKKVIDKKVKEINIAQKNRAQIVNSGDGVSTEVHQMPKDNILSENQLNSLKNIAKSNNWDEKTTSKFIDETKKRLASAK